MKLSRIQTALDNYEDAIRHFKVMLICNVSIISVLDAFKSEINSAHRHNDLCLEPLRLLILKSRVFANAPKLPRPIKKELGGEIQKCVFL